jgi:hypothetical protein
MAKHPLDLQWIESLLPSDFIRKSMFGGFGYYVDEKMVLALFESVGDRTYRGKQFQFDLWNGCLFPTDRENHREILKKYPVLFAHPILPKWLYLPSSTESFDDNVEAILREIRRKSNLWGTVPKSKKSKAQKLLSEKLTAEESKMDTSKPTMFRDEPAAVRLGQARKISDLKNLGPSSEAAFAKAGIRSVQHFQELGWKKALVKLVQSNPKNRHSIFTYALIGALKNQDWNRLSEDDKKTARDYTASLKIKFPTKPKKKILKKKASTTKTPSKQNQTRKIKK